jgi:Mn-dependent DtxR family transcriptional regulator
MIIEPKILKKVKIWIATSGKFAKSKLANELNVQPSQISIMLETGSLPSKHLEKLLEIIK